MDAAWSNFILIFTKVTQLCCFNLYVAFWYSMEMA